MPARISKTFPMGRKLPHREHRSKRGRDPRYQWKKNERRRLAEKRRRQDRYDDRDYENLLSLQPDGET